MATRPENIQSIEVHKVGDRQYQIYTYWIDWGWQVVIFDERMRQLGPKYSVTLETEQDVQAYQHESALAALQAIAKSDLDAGRVGSRQEAA